MDDALTTGGSALKAARAVEAIGATVSRILCIVDRLQGARETLRDYEFQSLFTLDDILADKAVPL